MQKAYTRRPPPRNPNSPQGRRHPPPLVQAQPPEQPGGRSWAATARTTQPQNQNLQEVFTMTNTTIITNALKAHGMTDDQLQQLLTAYNGDLPFHTAPEWSRRGYHIKAGAAPLFDCYLWKHTSKPSRAAVEAAQEAGEDVPESSPHFYKKLSNIYSFAQVEKNAPAPDLATIKARLDSLPGLTYKVKGEKTGAPNVWIIDGADAHAEIIKALGGIWSKKKSAYWIKPGTATAPAEDEPAAPIPTQARPAFTLPPARLVLPAPAQLLALPAPKADPDQAPAPVRETAPKMQTLTIHPGRPTPQPWKKCSFYTIRRDRNSNPAAHKADGYTDGIYNYYSTGEKSKTWYAVHPVYGTAVASANSRRAAQEQASEISEKINRYVGKPTDIMKHFAAIIKAAQDNGNLSLF